jgi:phosphatidate cytidylyltransferase
MATVIVNDVSAYFAGITFGRKFITAPFLALSPNKTWEGFIGAFICTMIFSFVFPAMLAKYTWFTCPAEVLSVWPSREGLHCIPPPVFQLHEYTIPYINKVIELYPMQFHGLAYGIFASFFAPFGGFFASAVKRAYNKKDFDSFMPGHGGMMDRMDCQLFMITFNSFYYNHVIANRHMTVEHMLLLATRMPVEQQLQLWKEVSCGIYLQYSNKRLIFYLCIYIVGCFIRSL